jgi:DNA processing protein
MREIQHHIKELEDMKKYPSKLFYIGNTSLLYKPKISIVGTRRPIQYTKNYTYNIAQKLSKAGICVVSGVAMGVDAIAHQGAGSGSTIAVVANGLDIRYPSVNAKLIEDIENNGLVLSQFEAGTPSHKYNFPTRNEVVVALGEVLVVTQADKKSGTMRSVEHALNMGKKIFVLPHRVGESDGTNYLLQNNFATPIYDVDEFISTFSNSNKTKENIQDDFLLFCQSNPTLESATHKFGNKVYEYELDGKIEVRNGKVFTTA